MLDIEGPQQDMAEDLDIKYPGIDRLSKARAGVRAWAPALASRHKDLNTSWPLEVPLISKEPLFGQILMNKDLQHEVAETHASTWPTKFGFKIRSNC